MDNRIEQSTRSSDKETIIISIPVFSLDELIAYLKKESDMNNA